MVQHEQQSGSLRDLSGGGLRMMSSYDMHQGSHYLISVPVDGITPFQVGEVRWKYDMDSSAAYPYQYGIMFTNIDAYDQEVIIKHLFDLQRTALKRSS
jgi:c-di-GMP-binding flagellar brake protein YcgR